MDKLFWYSYYAMTGIELLILIPFILNYKLFDRPSLWIFYYIVSSIVFAVGSDVIGYLFHNNMWFFNFMNLVQFVIISLVYLSCIKSRVIKRVILFMPIVVALVFGLDIFVIEGFYHYNSISAGIKSIVILIYGVIFFWQMLNDKELIEKSIYIDALPSFWYNSGIFLFYCTVFLFNISYNVLQQVFRPDPRGKVISGILTINNFVGIVSMILLYIGLSKLKKLRYADS
ncbi:hypothetical protein HGH93_07735 [Chitinophaga polysaccharea]|uniref:hypothetical protein n=1 Tax=Chitinophaga TaxID=79328 RepID=UPI001454F681|nr:MULTISPECIES: hypothetical protein [Chitinophaga]NLR57987.1 hypothetical protein [Chitinophaga polysaccharea]NLU93580.1 hypothetical protein [Chitinophaga sp. Ak27]